MSRFREISLIVSPNQLPQHVLQDAPVLVILNLKRRIDSRHGLECFLFSFVVAYVNPNHHSGSYAGCDSLDIKNLKPRQAEVFGVLFWPELQRKYSHADEVAPMNALETLGQYRLDAEKAGAFCGPIPRGA